MALLLIALFVVVPAVEIYVLIQVGHAIGAAATVALLLADAALGAALSRREGRKAWRALRTALAEQRLPAREVVDGALVVLGGAFLLTRASSPTSSACSACSRRPGRSCAAR